MLSSPFQKALVTGATSGIGQALSFLLADQGIPLIISGRDPGKLQEMERRLSAKVAITSVICDLLEQQQRNQLIEQIHKSCPDLVINSAGFGLYGEVVHQRTQELLDMLTVNGTALLHVTLETVKALSSHGKRGTIVNISSAAAFIPFPRYSLYSATKAFVNHFSVSLDEEMRKKGIRVLVACPGMVRTSFRSRAYREGSQGHSKHSMEPQAVAEQIWWQIQKGKQLYVFNWKYRLGILFSRFLLPRRLLMSLLAKTFMK